MMSNQDRDSAGDALNEKLLLLSDAEEQVCKVLQLSADTCAELEKLPFSDPEQLQTLSSAMITALQSIRTSIVGSLDSIQPIDVQQFFLGSADETTTLRAALEKFT